MNKSFQKIRLTFFDSSQRMMDCATAIALFDLSLNEVLAVCNHHEVYGLQGETLGQLPFQPRWETEIVSINGSTDRNSHTNEFQNHFSITCLEATAWITENSDWIRRYSKTGDERVELDLHGWLAAYRITLPPEFLKAVGLAGIPFVLLTPG